MRKAALVILIAVLSASSAFAANWPQWRGPAFNGSTDETNLPEKWTMTKNMAWIAPMPGPSGGTPVVWEDRVFVSSIDKLANNLLAICIDAKTGKVLWKNVVGKNVRFARNNNAASPSPITDGKTAWFYYGTGDLVAFDFSGKRLWSRSITKDHGAFEVMFGYSSSPLLLDGKLIIPVLQEKTPNRYRRTGNEGKVDSFLLAADAKTGKDVWKRVRKTDARGETLEAYITPMPFKHNGRTEVLIFGADYLTSHKPETGEELWRWGEYNPKRIWHWRVVPSAVPGDGLIYVVAPKHGPLFAIRASGKGVAWKFDRLTPDASTPLLYGGRLYVLEDDRKIINCLDAKTGRKIWDGRLGGNAVYRASLTGADGKLYCMNESGEVIVMKAGDSFEVLHRMRMGRPYCRSSIVASGGRLFIRTDARLYCVTKIQ